VRGLGLHDERSMEKTSIYRTNKIRIQERMWHLNPFSDA
jgi:hypothetical protein